MKAQKTKQRVRAALRRHGLVRHPRMLRELRRRGIRFTSGNRIVLFEDGAGGLAAMRAAIRAARRRIHLETYILRDDETGRRFLAALEERAAAGVVVRLLYDGFGSLGLDPGALEGLSRRGAQIVVFNPLRRFYPRWLPRRRDHRKLLVVDGEIGYVGGLNIGDEYDKGPADGALAWRDTHARVEGPAVTDLEAVFLESWFRADGPDLPWRELLGARPQARGDEHCSVVADGPSYHRRIVRDLLVTALETAEKSVKLTSPYFAPDAKVLAALLAASRRGVDVTLLLAGRSDHPILRRAARWLLPRLIAAGVRVFEYEPAMLHAKCSVIDDGWSIVGTSNLDRQSFEHSYEVNLVVDGERTAAALGDAFARDLERSARIDEAALAARGRLERIADWCASWVLRLI
jgi:cardiolipin synthase